ncbi:MAG: helix-turn-helix domain-containing protein [Chloroflexota bacterium]|nr:MAG: AraC family transcriptional regulator [Chloroflexota bacterium]
MTPPRHRFVDLSQLRLSPAAGSYTADMLSWGFIEPSRWRNYLHVHSFFEVCYAFAGRGTFRIGGADHEVRAGGTFVAKPGEPHEILSSDDNPLGIYFWAYTLALSSDGRTDAMDVDALFTAFTTSTRPVSDHASTMQTTIELLTAEIVRKDAGYIQVIEGLVLKLLLDTGRAVVDPPVSAELPPRPVQNPAELVVDRITMYLHDNCSRPVSVRDVAAQVHLSQRHTSRLFHAAMGVSIAEYLTALRMDIATRLLLERRLSIKEVAHATGHQDVRYFTTLFRRRMGLPPAAFRRQSGTQFIDPS